MGNRVKGKVIVVTGAAQGIGFGCAKLLAAEGASVVVADKQKGHGEQAAEKICWEGGVAKFCLTDVTSEEQCATLMEFAVDMFGRIDGLVNNAGWFPRGTLEETTTGLWEQVMQVNLRSSFYCCKYAVPKMRKTGKGSIVNIGSICGLQSLPNLVAYGAAKGGLLSLTKTLARGVGGRSHSRQLRHSWLGADRRRTCLTPCARSHRRGIEGDRRKISAGSLPDAFRYRLRSCLLVVR